jgi:hypothetical protein
MTPDERMNDRVALTVIGLVSALVTSKLAFSGGIGTWSSGPSTTTRGRAGRPRVEEPEQLIVALRAYERIGVEHMALQFMAPRWSERRKQIERVAGGVMLALRNG